MDNLSRRELLNLVDPSFTEDIEEPGIVDRLRHNVSKLRLLLHRLLFDESRLYCGKEIFPGGIEKKEVETLRRLYRADEESAGIRLDSHTMGGPSEVQKALMDLVFDAIQKHRVEAWDMPHGFNLIKIYDLFKVLVADLMGVDSPSQVIWGSNVTDLHRLVLHAIPKFHRKNVFYDEDHFCSIHKMMADPLKKRALDFQQKDWLKKLPEDCQAVLISHAGYKTGALWNVENLIEQIHSVAPLAVILIDCYQSAGTVPIEIDALGPRVVGIFGGHKQLNAATGAAGAAFSKETINFLEEQLRGWWSEYEDQEMWKYIDGPVTQDLPEDKAEVLAGGTPDDYGMARLVAELSIIRFLGKGSVQEGVRKIREKTKYQTELMKIFAKEQGFKIISPEMAEERNSMLILQHPKVPSSRLKTELQLQKIFCDIRPGKNGEGDMIRMSVNAYTLDLEIQEVFQTIARLVFDYQHPRP